MKRHPTCYHFAELKIPLQREAKYAMLKQYKNAIFWKRFQ